jgi:hypothetical protein
MGNNERKKFRGVKLTFVLWAIRIIVGSSIAFIAKKVDNYLDEKYGQKDYDNKIIELWESIKTVF